MELPEVRESWGNVEDRGGFGEIACLVLLILALALMVWVVGS